MDGGTGADAAVVASDGPPVVSLPVPPECQAPAGVSTTPATIDEVVALVNALPHPLALPCFLQSLARPLVVSSSKSVLSLQPAMGVRSPRIFLLSKTLVISVVPSGDGSHLAEFGEFVDESHTIKGELAFPITEPIAPGYPYERVRMGMGTKCGICHEGEVAAPKVATGNGFSSSALKPTWRDVVDLSFIRGQRDACDAAAEPYRCEVLQALFDHGLVTAGSFPMAVPTFTN